ncbi:MAG: hypothetical protein M0Q95_20370, partial [Porticoccaceae bacterium]|nr:hypothetical protein [Porticoccaceae bacterium]
MAFLAGTRMRLGQAAAALGKTRRVGVDAAVTPDATRLVVTRDTGEQVVFGAAANLSGGLALVELHWVGAAHPHGRAGGASRAAVAVEAKALLPVTAGTGRLVDARRQGVGGHPARGMVAFHRAPSRVAIRAVLLRVAVLTKRCVGPGRGPVGALPGGAVGRSGEPGGRDPAHPVGVVLHAAIGVGEVTGFASRVGALLPVAVVAALHPQRR